MKWYLLMSRTWLMSHKYWVRRVELLMKLKQAHTTLIQVELHCYPEWNYWLNDYQKMGCIFIQKTCQKFDMYNISYYWVFFWFEESKISRMDKIESKNWWYLQTSMIWTTSKIKRQSLTLFNVRILKFLFYKITQYS